MPGRRRKWQRRRDEQNGGTGSTHSTSLSRSSLGEERESGASTLLPLLRLLLPNDELAGAVRRSREQGREENGEPSRGMRGWFRGWGARHERPPPRLTQGSDAANDAAQ